MLKLLRGAIYTLCWISHLHHASATDLEAVDAKMSARILEAISSGTQKSELKECLTRSPISDVKIATISDFFGRGLFSVKCDARYRDFPVLLRDNRVDQIIMPIINERGRIETSEFCSALSKSISKDEFFCTTCSDIAPSCVRLLFKIWRQHSGVSVELLSSELVSRTK